MGAKDPAPPLTMTLPKDLAFKGKVDEKSTAAALGYVGLLVQILGNLSGVRKEGGLSYPITCAGSRSLVKDTVSIMQGPRSSVFSPVLLLLLLLLPSQPIFSSLPYHSR